MMKTDKPTRDVRQPRDRLLLYRVLPGVALFLLLLVGLTVFSSHMSARAAAGDVTIEVVEVGGGAVSEFRYIINEDIAHDSPSTTPPRSYSEIVATGDDTNATVNLPDGKYLVTVVGGPFAPPAPDKYKMSGKHFSVNGNEQTVTVELVPNPLPLATLRVRVFHDNNSVNGEDDIPFEAGIEGFPVSIHDPTGEVTVDFFGDPLCGGQCVTDADGYVTIPNLPPLKYEVTPIPPDGSGWVQTTTIEGTHANDAWLEEGASGYSTEEGFLQAIVWFGFVRECSFGDPQDDCQSNNNAGTGTINGRVRQIALDTEAPGDVTLGPAVFKPYVALNNIGGNDEQVYMGRGNEDGTFTIPNVPAGLYQLVYWDFPQLYIIQFRTVQVGPGETVNLGDIGIPRWRGVIQGYAYIDNGVAKDGTPIPGGAENGFRDCYGGAGPHDVEMCEPGLPGQDLDIRQKDGTIVYTAFADSNGYYDFPDYFEWEHFLIWEVGFGRLKQVGTTGYFTELTNGGLTVSPVGYPYNPENGPALGLAGLLQAQLTPAGVYQWFDTGKVPYGSGENGGISGIVYYATTRNEFDPRLAAAEDYEPGIPNVTINLYQAALDANQQPIPCGAVGPGCPYGNGEYQRMTDVPMDSVMTDSWDDNLPMDCMYETPVPGSGNFVNDPQCLELPNRFRQIKDGVFDGGYAFEGTPAGAYIVEVDPSTAGPYRQIREEDQNTDQGDDFIPQVPPPECAGPLHLVNDPRNPADGQMTPLCDSKFVRVIDGFNAPAEFYLMTDFPDAAAVPPPGLLRGLLLDDLTVQLNPDSNIFLEKRGIPNTPVGILDFEGNEVAVVNSDDDGYWEVLLPSTYTVLCPTPGGVCPGMYQVIGNYPGSDPLHPLPDWNPNYGTLRLVFDVWPGRTTYADVAIFPITGFIQDPDSGFNNPPVCEIPATTPDLQEVSAVYGNKGGDINFFIYGANFDNPTVTLDGTPITVNGSTSDTIDVTVSSGFPQGAHQLMVTNGNGQVSQNGITFHVLGSGGGPPYNPPMKHVGSGQTYATIQDALDAASDGDLIVVHPGIYYENVIISRNVKLQGYGPGATSIDGRFFNFGGLTPAEFQAMVATINPVGPTPVPMGQTITVLARSNGQHNNSQFPTQIDGFAIRGGSRVRGNVAVPSQGGGVYAHAFARRLHVSNNLVQSNAGTFGGGIILGQAYVGNSNNNLAHIHHNRVLNNGGVSLAGGIAMFRGSNEYEIDHNVICGNYSGEYGGGISHFGMSDLGSIHDNQILYNYAFDEGGGIMVAGESSMIPNALSDGSGEVEIMRNLIQGNLSNDDGGGIRLLQPVAGPVHIVNNMVVNNLATDLGGGISLDDALEVHIVNNTVARNITTATAEDADRSTCSPPALGSCPHAAGISSEPHSQTLLDNQGLPPDSFSNPLLFNNILWQNEAFYLDGTGALPSAGFIDLEVVGTTVPQFMTPNYSLLTAPYGSGVGNITGSDPMFVFPINLNFIAVPFAGDPAFVNVLVISGPGDPQGDYHLLAGSPAIDAGMTNFGGILAPSDDFDGDTRDADPDMGADEVVP